MTKDYVQKKIVEAFVAWCRRSPITFVYWATASVVVVELDNEDLKISFDLLAALAAALDTKLIDIEHQAGWAGTDVTPGDPATLKLWITLTANALEG